MGDAKKRPSVQIAVVTVLTIFGESRNFISASDPESDILLAGNRPARFLCGRRARVMLHPDRSCRDVTDEKAHKERSFGSVHHHDRNHYYRRITDEERVQRGPGGSRFDGIAMLCLERKRGMGENGRQYFQTEKHGSDILARAAHLSGKRTLRMWPRAAPCGSATWSTPWRPSPMSRSP